MRELELAACYIQLAIEAVLLYRIDRRAWPICWTFLVFEIVRSIITMPLAHWFPNLYVPAWGLGEWICIALIAMMGVEAKNSLLQNKLNSYLECIIVLTLVVCAAILLTPLSLRWFFVARSIVDFSVVASLLVVSLWLSRFNWHVACLTSFALIDLVGYLTMTMPGKLPLRIPQTFLMIGDGLVFSIWAIKAQSECNHYTKRGDVCQ